MDEIPFDVNNQVIEDNYDIETSLHQIFRYYKTMIRRSINVGDAKESESNLTVNISKIDRKEYQISIKQNCIGPKKKDIIKYIKNLNINSHPDWIYSPYVFMGEDDTYEFISNPPDSESYCIRFTEDSVAIVDGSIRSKSCDGTELIIDVTKPDNIIKIGQRIRNKLDNMDKVPNRKYNIGLKPVKQVKEW